MTNDATVDVQAEVPFSEDDDLIEEIRALRQKLKVHGDLMRKMNFRSRSSQVLSGLCVLVVTAALMVAWSNRQAIQAVTQQRDESRVTACSSWNDLLDVISLSDVNVSSESLRLTFAVDPDNLTADEQVLYDTYRQVAADTSKRDIDIVRRNCSPAGLAAFYDGDPLTTGLLYPSAATFTP